MKKLVLAFCMAICFANIFAQSSAPARQTCNAGYVNSITILHNRPQKSRYYSDQILTDLKKMTPPFI